MSKFYTKNIAEGKGLLGFAIVFAVVIRFFYYFSPSASNMPLGKNYGYIWHFISPWLSNQLVSITLAALSVVFIAFLVNYTNNERVFIRQRTVLPVALAVLFFSGSPLFLRFSPLLLVAIVVVYIINSLFEGHGMVQKQKAAFKVSFYLVLGSLFAPGLFLFLPVIWITLIRLRSFDFKGFLASIFSLTLWYIPAITLAVYLGEWDKFIAPFQSFLSTDWANLPILRFSIEEYILVGSCVLLLGFLIMDNSLNGFKDKIRVRGFLAVLSILEVYAFLLILFLDTNSAVCLTVFLAALSLHAGHFFALAENKRGMLILFTLFAILYFIISLISLF